MALDDGRHGVLSRGDDRVTDAVPELFDARATAAFGQPDVRLNVRPTVHGTQTAIVVGSSGGDLHTDRDNRIRVQLDWQRGNAAARPAIC